jgi:hypothetical protein
VKLDFRITAIPSPTLPRGKPGAPTRSYSERTTVESVLSLILVNHGRRILQGLVSPEDCAHEGDSGCDKMVLPVCSHVCASSSRCSFLVLLFTSHGHAGHLRAEELQEPFTRASSVQRAQRFSGL